MYVGVRAGGGIGDEIEDPAGDDYELYRVVFDITFFFFVIVILLAIIQGEEQLKVQLRCLKGCWWYRSWMMFVLCAGLIIDAFGELRDQQEQVREDMEVWPLSLTRTQMRILGRLVLDVKGIGLNIFLCFYRLSASFVELEATTLTRLRTALRRIRWKSTI